MINSSGLNILWCNKFSICINFYSLSSTFQHTIRFLRRVRDGLGGPKDSDGKWSCRFCQENTFKVVQNGQKVSGNHTSGLPEIIEIDDRGRSIRHLLAPVSVGGCAICK